MKNQIVLMTIKDAEGLYNVHCDICKRNLEKAKKENKNVVLINRDGYHITTMQEAEIILMKK